MEILVNIICQRLSFGQDIANIREDLIAQKLTDEDIFLAYVAAKMLLESA